MVLRLVRNDEKPILQPLSRFCDWLFVGILLGLGFISIQFVSGILMP